MEDNLGEAIITCITAAAGEFDIEKQQGLLKAAAYGKAFCADLDPFEFVDTARKIRVLNEVRGSDIGLPLTYNQFSRLTPEVLVGRLCIRKFHFLALKICELLGLNDDRVVIHWAQCKIAQLGKTTATDDDIALLIQRKLKPYMNKISFLDIAASAYRLGRRRLAILILDFETHTADQVPLLLSMGDEELGMPPSSS